MFLSRTLTGSINKIILWVVFPVVGIVMVIWSLCPPWILLGHTQLLSVGMKADLDCEPVSGLHCRAGSVKD